MEELVGGRLNITARREGEHADGELTGQILLLIERPNDVALVVPLLGTPASRDITPEEEVGIEIGSGLC